MPPNLPSINKSVMPLSLDKPRDDVPTIEPDWLYSRNAVYQVQKIGTLLHCSRAESTPWLGWAGLAGCWLALTPTVLATN